MRILLDECVPWPLHRILVGHQCVTAQASGWGGIKNGELLRLAEGQFDLFITSDQNMQYQQNLAQSAIRILELSSNDLRRLLDAARLIQTALDTIGPGQLLHLEIP